MSNIIPFDFDGNTVRVTEEDGEPWFVAMDVADILGYSDAEAMTRRLDDDEKQNRQIVGVGPRGVTLINESGLYSAILGSQKEEARRFKKWVTSEVLPAIRKTGSYVAPTALAPKLVAPSKDFKATYSLLRLIGCDKQAAAIGANQATNQVHGTNLLALTGQTHLSAANQDSLYFTPTELGKRLGISGQKFNLMLAGAGLQAKNDAKTWELTESGKAHGRIYDTGKAHGNGVPVQQIKWAADVLSLLGEKEAS